MKKQFGLAGGLTALVMSFGANAGVVDLFSTDQGPYTDTTVNGVAVGGSVNGPVSDILGGNRDLFVDLKTSTGGNSATIQVMGGALSFSNQSLASSHGIIQWDGATDTGVTINPTGLGGIDLTMGNSVNAFVLDILFSDAGFKFIVTAYTDATHWTAVDLTSLAHPTLGTSFIPFSAFTNPGLCNSVNPAPGVNSITCSDASGNAGGTQVVDMANLGALAVDLDPNGSSVAVDLSLNAITTVPEPSVLALMGAGLLGLGGLSRRRKKIVA